MKLLKIKNKVAGMKSAEYKVEGENIYLFKCYSEEAEKDVWRINDEKINNLYEENMDMDFDYFEEAKQHILI